MDLQGRGLVLGQTPGHQVAKGSHPVFLHLISPKIAQGKIEETSQLGILDSVDFSLPGVKSQLPHFFIELSNQCHRLIPSDIL